MRRAWAVVLVAVAAAEAAAPGPAHAADLTNVASSFDDDNPFDFRFRVRYDHTEKRAQIKREFQGLTPTQARTLTLRDLVYAQSRDTLSLRAEIGLFQDLMLHVELPIILGERAEYGYDQSAGAACRFVPDPMANCVNGANSSTVRDGFVDAATAGSIVFQGANRGAAGGGGLDAFDTFNFGLTWAPVSQKRDDTKPTWVLAIEPQLSIGNIKAYDRARPNANHAVSEGVHRLYARTAISRRWHWVDPYMGFWYMYPIARGDSLYKDYGPAQKLKNPQQEGGTTFGVELVPFERHKDGHKVWIDLRGRLQGHFAGRGYSEAWELLAGAPTLGCDAAQAPYNPACSGMTTNPYQGQPFTGITTIENYASLGADIALGVQVGQHARFRTSFEYTHDQSHFITGEDIGVPSTSSGRVMNANEFNPAYRATIDQVGRRYRVDNVDIYNFTVYGQIQF
ncbi:MAG: hypothetical protein JWN44_868 [Myxococcales bacterium]|nr:hypothetical protein [Myxococcales bacterium]